MKKTITLSDFRDAFTRMGRKDQFSYEGLGALYQHLEEIAENYDLDVIALCCEYTESTLAEAQEAYPNLDIESFMDLEKHTSVIPVGDYSVIYVQF